MRGCVLPRPTANVPPYSSGLGAGALARMRQAEGKQPAGGAMMGESSTPRLTSTSIFHQPARLRQGALILVIIGAAIGGLVTWAFAAQRAASVGCTSPHGPVGSDDSLAGGPRPIPVAATATRIYGAGRHARKATPSNLAHWHWYNRSDSQHSLHGRCKVVRDLSRGEGTARPRQRPSFTAPDYIPVYGIPVAGDPQLYLLRLLYSIDIPVQHLVVVYGGAEPYLHAEIKHITNHIPHVDLIHCPDMLGCGEAFNIIIRHYYADAPWFLISANDVAWPPVSCCWCTCICSAAGEVARLSLQTQKTQEARRSMSINFCMSALRRHYQDPGSCTRACMPLPRRP